MKEEQALEIVRAELPTFQALIQLNSKPGTDVATIAKQELEYLRMHSLQKPEIMQCIPETIIMGIKSVIKKNLSLDPSAGLVYVKTRNVKVKNPNGTEGWAKALEIQDTANGIISINRQCGRILDVERPKIIKDDKGKVVAVTFKYMVPSYNEQGKPATRWNEVEFDESDFLRWKRASHKENSRGKEGVDNSALNYANPNYSNWQGGPDPEFIRAKAIRHGLKKLGANQHETLNRQPFFEDIPHETVVNTSADAAAASDGEGNEYSNYEEVQEGSPVVLNQVIEMPTADQL